MTSEAAMTDVHSFYRCRSEKRLLSLLLPVVVIISSRADITQQVHSLRSFVRSFVRSFSIVFVVIDTTRVVRRFSTSFRGAISQYFLFV